MPKKRREDTEIPERESTPPTRGPYDKRSSDTDAQLMGYVSAVKAAVGEINIARIARELGLHEKAVGRFVEKNREEIERRAQALNLELIERIGDKISLTLGAIDKAKVNEAKFRDLTIGLGVLVDKRAMLLGRQFGLAGPNYRVRFSQREPDGRERSIEIGESS